MDSATRAGSCRSYPPGRPLGTSQNRHPRVQMFPSIMKVAVPLLQHSPRLGQLALWHTVFS